MNTRSAGLEVELDVFEGPLDLLLHLVKKHELEILDIPISFITEKYLEYLDLMSSLNLDVAGEYLLMAATLAHIKSRQLLPPDPSLVEPDELDSDDDLDPRADLIRRLLEYQKYKEAATHLGHRPVVGRNVWPRGTPQEEALSENVDADTLAPLAEVPIIKLVEALDRALRRAKVKLAHNVVVDRLSVAERISELADRLERERSFEFLSLFSFLEEGAEVSLEEIRHEAVVTFLAILEMAKLRLITITQVDGDDEILIARATSEVRARVAGVVASKDDYR